MMQSFNQGRKKFQLHVQRFKHFQEILIYKIKKKKLVTFNMHRRLLQAFIILNRVYHLPLVLAKARLVFFTKYLLLQNTCYFKLRAPSLSVT